MNAFRQEIGPDLPKIDWFEELKKALSAGLMLGAAVWLMDSVLGEWLGYVEQAFVVLTMLIAVWRYWRTPKHLRSSFGITIPRDALLGFGVAMVIIVGAVLLMVLI